MLLQFLHSKIHQARVTKKVIDYHGSLTVDEELLEEAGMRVGQQIQVYDQDNGARFETYILRGDRGSRQVQVNGAAARLVEAGDRIIICTFAVLTPQEAENWEPRVIICDDHNNIIDRFTYSNSFSAERHGQGY